VGSNYNLLSEVPDYGAKIEVSNKFWKVKMKKTDFNYIKFLWLKF
jgi:hypothetical protein